MFLMFVKVLSYGRLIKKGHTSNVSTVEIDEKNLNNLFAMLSYIYKNFAYGDQTYSVI